MPSFFLPKIVSGETSVIFDRPPDPDSRFPVEEIADTKIMSDGSPKKYLTAMKQKCELKFTGLSASVYASLKAIKESGNTLDYYEDQDDAEPLGTFIWEGNFEFSEHQYAKGNFGKYSGSMTLREV